MNVAICDDEKLWHQKLIMLLKEYQFERHIDIFIKDFLSGESLISSEMEYDITFMDYQMDRLDGIETARKIREINTNCIIIFISSYPQVALDTFEVDTFRFLTKPIDKAKLFKSLDDYRKKADADELLMFKAHDGAIKMRTSEIVYCEALGKHTMIYTQKAKYEILINIKEVEKKLPSEKFFRCHKGFLVSFLHIKFHNNTDIFFEKDKKAQISRRYLVPFKAALQEYILKYNAGEI